MQVKRIIALSEAGDYSPGPVPMMMRSAMAEDASAKTSIAAGEQAVGVTVTAVFELQ